MAGDCPKPISRMSGGGEEIFPLSQAQVKGVKSHAVYTRFLLQPPKSSEMENKGGGTLVCVFVCTIMTLQ